MRLLHTSDWHLGRTLHGIDLLEYQAAYLDHLVALTREEQVDAVLVAGDVYDRAVPSVEAVAVLSGALARLSELTTVVLTSGNHDSSVRLGFGAALMRQRVRLCTAYTGVDQPVVVGGALVYGLPYLDPDFARTALSEATDDDGLPVPLTRSHRAVLSAAMRRVLADRAARPERRAVVMAHAFVTGGQPSESERDIRVGGVDQVPASVFAGVDYVALGHLHGPQVVSASEGTV
ncbi:MAG: exonuclease subunit SbcD, partial [Micrococcales bacterium]|nr:exonuclease subunit SbcD [Micrococcales bacterium]